MMFKYFCFMLQVTALVTADFIEEPRNMTIEIGESALIPCTLQDAALQPNWRINDNTYTVSTLPTGLAAVSSGLMIDGSIAVIYNQSSFQCFIVKYVGPPPPLYSTIVSSTGILTVIMGAILMPTSALQVTLSTTINKSVGEFTSDSGFESAPLTSLGLLSSSSIMIHSSQVTQFLQSSHTLTVNKNTSQYVSTIPQQTNSLPTVNKNASQYNMSTTPQQTNSLSRNNFIALVAGISCASSLILCFGVILISILIALAVHRISKQKKDRASIPIEENIAYISKLELDRIRHTIVLHDNSAYGQVNPAK